MYVLLSAPILAALTYILAATKLFNFPFIYPLLVSVAISTMSLFVIPRFIRKSIESGDQKRVSVSILISVLAVAPFLLALSSWVNYTT